ncbi:MAG: AraC family transcriptional regulator, partial [Clostridiales bacterium]|nr:AraC family transcriptional regulator [Clostridiales bacterium]
EVTYIIEGKTYVLKPWDILLVGRNDIHQPIISSDVPYERIILWLNPNFLDAHKKNDCDLQTCFLLTTKRKMNMIRLNKTDIPSLKQTLDDLEDTINEKSFGQDILKNSLFIQLMVKINRLFFGMDLNNKLEDVHYDPRIESILSYINDNLENELTIDLIGDKFYLNKYYLMHLFKKETGYTVYNYIQKKRVIKAADYIKSGMPAGNVCSLTGFNDYSTFVRTFKKEFNLSPKQYYKAYINKLI